MGPPDTIRAVPFKAAAQYVAGLALAVGFVVLLSFTFSFLGTIFCAALAGMMLGALRIYKWQSIPVSLVFPLVIFTLLRWMKSELSDRQVVLVSLGCFALFWLTYAVAVALFFFERKGPASASRPSPTQSACPARPEGELLAERASAKEAEVPKHNGWLSLDMLQGTWTPEARGPVQFLNCRMSIQKEELTLSVADAKGQIRIVASAQLKLCAADAQPTLRISQRRTVANADTHVSI